MFQTIMDKELGAFNFILFFINQNNIFNFLAKEIYQWLSPPDSSRNQYEAIEKHQKGTCSWIFENDQFKKWEKTLGFFWIKGKGEYFLSHLCKLNLLKISIAGCGKSILW